MAFHALGVNKLRTTLSLLGISIGIFTIILVFTVVDSLEKNVKESVASMGDNVIYVQKWPWAFGSDYPWWKYLRRPIPSYKEMEELQLRSTQAEAISFEAYLGNKLVKHDGSSAENVTIGAVSHEFAKIKTIELADGRYFTDHESATGSPIAIVGWDVARSLFGTKPAVGKEVQTLGRKFTVIGVFVKEGSTIIGKSLDEIIIIPVNYARSLMNLRSESIQPFIQVKGKPGVTNDELKGELMSLMRSIRRIRPLEEEDFALNESKLLSNQVNDIFKVLGVAGWIIGGFSILVGGFGIANIMFVSVKERTNIIGIQKSLGAKNYFILIQFLSEAISLCLIGGAVGLLFVFTVTMFATYVAEFNMMLSIQNIIQGLAISAVIGIISGFIPAYTASQLDPVEAIRSGI
jgi:putative ABC transport system permease protein